MRKTIFILFLLTNIFGCTQKEKKISLDSEEFSKVIKVLESGNWVSQNDNCEEKYQSFKFNIKKRTVDLTITESTKTGKNSESTYTYNIFWAWDKGFRGKIRKENRLDGQGKPVQWDLILSSDNSFYWRRGDWSKYSGTNTIKKCQ